ncbi:MAG TPA: hypothetical protein PKD09_17815 [Aggregatilinea sp.]|uniref:hypothetical protein n=1 Tax=Aggregatilinea sp. TaxID=2806333 RepID=UPI002C903115|nr:hypothetical protein [Aggregatilinea sp.]HML23518.1 hypothetical protein [Aggregatilinea sp.]
MSDVLLRDLVEGVRSTLATAVEVERATAHEALTEDMPDAQMLEIYAEEGSADPTTKTDRTTFGGGLRQERCQVMADYYTRLRSSIGDDMALLIDGIDSIRAVLNSQDHQPLFGTAGIVSFTWSWQRVIFERASKSYVGARFTLDFRLK